MRFSDISNSSCWYQKFELLISEIWFRDITNFVIESEILVFDIINCIADVNKSNQ